MLKKVLIANRGEIAVRIIRTARRLGVKTVAVASEPDRRAPFAAMADELVEIGPGPATESYLRIDKIIAAAKSTGADAIHPGYGFLAENADFADAVGKAGIKFIGPSPGRHAPHGRQGRGQGDRCGKPACRWCRAIRATIKPPRRWPGKPSASATRDDQGGGRRWRARHAARRARGGSRRGARERTARGAGRVRRCARADGEGDRRAAPHRGAGVRRQPRQRGAPVRARLHAAAAQPEGDRGSAGAGHVARAAREDVRGGSRMRQGRCVRGCRHGRVPGRGRQAHRRKRPGTSSR